MSDSPMLTTKIRVPPRHGHQVSRPRLLAALSSGVLSHPLTLVAAPAGYGKTTLLQQWARAAPVPVAWYAIDEADNQRIRFLRHLVAAWKLVWPEIAESPMGLLLGSSESDPGAALAASIELFDARPRAIALVLDDYHLIDEPVIHRDIAFLLDHLSPSVHIVIAGRAEPPLPVSRYRARQQLFALGADDLRLRHEEAAAFLHEARGLDLPAETIATLNGAVEGWAAGLQLWSLTMSPAAALGGPPSVSGRHRFIADYLRAEVLAPLPDRLRRFLLLTSVLDRLSAPLCDAVTASTGSQATLEELERANLFVMPLDDRREWFRYHSLFADLLRDELARRSPDEAPALHHRAGQWCLEQGMPDAAMEHALAGDDAALARSIFERHLSEQLNTGGRETVQRWLGMLPAAWLDRYPVLGLARAGLLLTSGAIVEGIRCIDEVDSHLPDTADTEAVQDRAMVAAVRCFVACTRNDLPEAERLAEHALRDLPTGDSSFRSDVCHALGDTYRRNSRWDEASAMYREVLRIHHGPSLPMRAASVYGALADLELRRGRLRAADANWRQALAAVEDDATWGRLPLTVTGWVHLRIAEAHYERHELAAAREHLARGLARADLGGDAQTRLAGHVIAARLCLSDADAVTAAAHLDQVRSLAEQEALPDWTSRFERCQLDLWLETGHQGAALAWVDAMLKEGTLDARPESEPARLGIVRVLLQRGDQPSLARARELLRRLAAAAEAEGRLGIRIEALALEALRLWRQGESAAAMIALDHALRLAEPEGYVRLFADLGLPFARLMQEARTRRVSPGYVERILAAGGLATAAQGTPEPLSGRERDVLRLLAAGLTNREIAETLFISPETVKKHTGAIFGKLGVGNRTEAAARARALQLLDD